MSEVLGTAAVETALVTPKNELPRSGSARIDLKALRFGEQYRESAVLADGTAVVLRLVRPSDSNLLIRGFDCLSPESRYRRFFGYKKILSPAEVEYFTDCDGIDHFALGAVIPAEDGEEQGVGIARFVRLRNDPTTADAAVTVIDRAQRNGLGRLLVARLVAAAAERQVRQLQFSVLTSNQPMRALLRGLNGSGEPAPNSHLGRGVLQFTVPTQSSGEVASAE